MELEVWMLLWVVFGTAITVAGASGMGKPLNMWVALLGITAWPVVLLVAFVKIQGAKGEKQTQPSASVRSGKRGHTDSAKPQSKTHH